MFLQLSIFSIALKKFLSCSATSLAEQGTRSTQSLLRSFHSSMLVLSGCLDALDYVLLCSLP